MAPPQKALNEEKQRQARDRLGRENWRQWGPYVSERQWGTVREDYSANGDAWDYFPHDHARSRAYRWGEDGIAGFCDRHQHICFALALWNEKDRILKERLFGLTNFEGNHGEDVKEYYYYLDAVPTNCYLKYLYKYPQAAFPYDQLRIENKKRTRHDPEYELTDTGVFNENRYFDVFVEYAKATFEDILVRITAWNRGPQPARLHLLPTLWFRNRWDWGDPYDMPEARLIAGPAGTQTIALDEFHYGKRWMIIEGAPEMLFTNNETNTERLYQAQNRNPFVKDAFHRYLIEAERGAVNPEMKGTKAAGHFGSEIPRGKSWTIRLRLMDVDPSDPLAPPKDYFGAPFEAWFDKRKKEADEFYEQREPKGISEDTRLVQRQAFAGLIWGKQSYHYDVDRWLKGDSTQPAPDPRRQFGRNHEWTHLHNSDVISMPDKWEYPWYAAGDLAFHCVAMALIDPDFAKDQLILFMREWYMHPNGQLPAYEWNFSDVNPPVQAWAALRVHEIAGDGDFTFLERVFHKLLLNFTWWVNRKDAEGDNLFEGGFLGLDNIGPFDRSQLPADGTLEQSDGSAWMAMFCQDMLEIALVLTEHDPVYEDLATKFFEHFALIAAAMNDRGLWNEEDGFYYDVLRVDGESTPLRARSIVALLPLAAVTTIGPETMARLPDFLARASWFIENRPEGEGTVAHLQSQAHGGWWMLSIVDEPRLRRLLGAVLDPDEVPRDHGLRGP